MSQLKKQHNISAVESVSAPVIGFGIALLIRNCNGSK